MKPTEGRADGGERQSIVNVSTGGVEPKAEYGGRRCAPSCDKDLITAWFCVRAHNQKRRDDRDADR